MCIRDRAFTHAFAGDGPLMWSRRLIVPFGDLCAVALFEDQLLLRQKIVREHSIQLPNLVQLVEFASGVVTVVADEFTDPGPVLLLHMGTIILVARPRPGERDLVIGAVRQQVVVDELRTVVETMPISALQLSLIH